MPILLRGIHRIHKMGGALMGSDGFWWVLMGFDGFWWVLMGLGWALMGLGWVLMGSDGFWWVLMGFDGSWVGFDGISCTMFSSGTIPAKAVDKAVTIPSWRINTAAASGTMRWACWATSRRYGVKNVHSFCFVFSVFVDKMFFGDERDGLEGMSATPLLLCEKSPREMWCFYLKMWLEKVKLTVFCEE